ncbi:hypothetical protein ACOME3_007037 [Neoechinorhynchus agilis]
MSTRNPNSFHPPSTSHAPLPPLLFSHCPIFSDFMTQNEQEEIPNLTNSPSPINTNFPARPQHEDPKVHNSFTLSTEVVRCFVASAFPPLIHSLMPIFLLMFRDTKINVRKP